MLQLLHLDVSKVDRVLHMRCVWEAADGADDVWGGMGGMGDVQGGTGPLLVRFSREPDVVCALLIPLRGSFGTPGLRSKR